MSQIAHLPFFSSCNSLYQNAARSHVTDTINKLVKEAMKSLNPEKDIEIVSSHGFRINLATTLIKEHEIRVAQQVLDHRSITTTTIYDRNLLSINQLQSMRVYLVNPAFSQEKDLSPELKIIAEKLLLHDLISQSEINNLDEMYSKKQDSILNAKINSSDKLRKNNYKNFAKHKVKASKSKKFS